MPLLAKWAMKAEEPGCLAAEQAIVSQERQGAHRCAFGPVARGPGRYAVPLLAAVGCGLVLALMGCSRTLQTPATEPPSAGSDVLVGADEPVPVRSGSLYRTVDYPAVVEEAVARIRETHPERSPSTRAAALMSR